MDRRKAPYKDKSPPTGLWRTWMICVLLGCVFIISTVPWCPLSHQVEKVFQTSTVTLNFQPRPQLPVITFEDFELALPEPVRSIYVQDAVVFPDNVMLLVNVQDAVVFPDNVMLLVKVSDALDLEGNIDNLECQFGNAKERSVTRVLSIKPRTHDVQMVRCKRPDVKDFPSNSYNVTLGIRDSDVKVQSNAVYNNSRLPQWSTLVYENLLDSDSLILLAKGLVSKSARRVDERYVKCVFGKHLPSEIFLETRVLAAAQEVVRCEKPPAHLEQNLRGYKVSVLASWLGVLPSVSYYNPDNSPEFFLASFNPIADSTKAKPTIRSKGAQLAMYSSPEEFKVLSSKNISVGTVTKRKLCACTMVWNKAQFIKEWVMFHSYIGVEKFFMYDNDSEDEIEDVLHSLASYNITRMLWPWIKTQQAAFSHCTVLARGECEWMMFSDVDEYIYAPAYLKSVKKDGPSNAMVLRRMIASESQKVEKMGGNLGEIQFDCNNFGPSGLKRTPKQGVTVGYTCRMEIPERHKSIVLLEAVNISLLNVLHHFELCEKFQSIKMNRRDAVINHYKYQAWDAFKMKFLRRAGTYTTDWQKSENTGSKDRTPGLGTEAVKPEDWESQFCEVHDTGLREFSLSNFRVHGKRSKLKWQQTIASVN